MKEYFRILSYAGDHKGLLYKSVLYLLFSVLFSAVPYFIISIVITTFVEKQPVSIQTLLLCAGGVLVSILLKDFLNVRGLDASHKLAYRTLMGMRKTLADKLMRVSMGTVAKHGTGNIKKSFVESMDEMELILAHAIPEGISNLIALLVIMVVMLIVDWRLALLALAVVPFGLLPYVMMMVDGMKRMKPFFESSQRMNQNVIEYISGMEVIKVFGQTTRSFKKYSDSVETHKESTLEWYKASWNYMTIYTVLLPTTLLFLLPFGTLIYVGGTLSLGGFVLSILLAMSIGFPFVHVLDFLSQFPQLQYKASMIETLLSEEDMPEGKSAAPKHHDIEFSNVTFAYGEKDVLKNVSFVAKENTVTAFVGESGAGKSTIAKLLVRFWDVGSGSIGLGGTDVRELPFETLMQQISYVSQDIFLFNASIIDNIRMGKPGATDAEVVEMARAAQCHEFILECEHGYNTIVGSAGDKLSGGQRQRIAIARAMLKNAPVVVLDEATSFTDPENEDNIQAALNNLIQGKTLIVIAHRLSTIMDADNIILMDNGEISMQGKHIELLEKSPIYAGMWQSHIESMEWDIVIREEANINA